MASLFRSVALLTSILVALGFVIFALDEAGKGSRTQLARLDGELGHPSPQPVVERARERKHGPVREAVDDANDVLLAPFTNVVRSHDAWVERGVPTLLALLVYGLGLTLVANYLPQPKRAEGDWRTT